MPSNNVEVDVTPEMKSSTNGVNPIIPQWIDEEHFIDVFRETCPGLRKVMTFTREIIGGDGENYASIMLRIKAKVELEDGSAKDIAYVIKIIPQDEQGALFTTTMGLFPKEKTMYSTHLPEFEQMYRNVGKNVTFCPKYYRLNKNPGAEYILLEDLLPRDFKNVNRLEGLDKEHTESVLRLLADLHAVSAVRYETKGKYDDIFSLGLLTEENRSMFSLLNEVILECYKKYNISKECLKKAKALMDQSVDLTIKFSTADPEDFNVLNHGDLWGNNIMFRHNDEGKLLETVFVDLQISRYASPGLDLYYLLLSSTNLDLKLSHFDYFVKYYHDHLAESLKLLKYPKKIPSLKCLRMQLLKHSILGFAAISGLMPLVLLDPSSDANMENYVQSGEDGKNFKMMMYSGARYIKHMEAILPWMELRGLLDI